MPETKPVARPAAIPHRHRCASVTPCPVPPQKRPFRVLAPLLATLACLISAHMALPAPALAHRVNIFGWVEGPVVHTESLFSNGNKARKSRVNATEAYTGILLANGTTDEDGLWSFSLPPQVIERGPDILLSLNAGEGHAATWLMEGEEFSTTMTDPSPDPEPDIRLGEDGGMAPGMESALSSGQQEGAGGKPATPADKRLRAIIREEVRSAVEEALERKLAPLRRKLAEETEPGPSLRDIMGGIGYIFGLAGVAALVASRRRR